MALKKRIIRVTLTMPTGVVIITDSLRMSVRIRKAALALQNRATIDVTGLTTQLRESLLSQFTAWNKRLADTTNNVPSWINVSIEAGYSSNGTERTSVVFVGQVVQVEPTSAPPNIGVRITCYSRQVDQTSYVSDPAPDQVTLLGYVTWAAGQMGLGTNFICQTSKNDLVITNAARSRMTHASILIDIQSIYRPDIVAFVDDNVLVVKDRDALINLNEVANVTQFIGIPTWTEWGVEFTTLFDPTILLAHGATITSKMNPSLNGQYVIMELEYDLTSRDRAFYVKANGNPPK